MSDMNDLAGNLRNWLSLGKYENLVGEKPRCVVGSVETAIFEWLEGFCCMVPYLNLNTLPWTCSKFSFLQISQGIFAGNHAIYPRNIVSTIRVPSSSRAAAIEKSAKNDPNGIQAIHPSSTPPANDEARMGDANKKPSPQCGGSSSGFSGLIPAECWGINS